MKLSQYVKKGRDLITDYHWAMVYKDQRLMHKYAFEKRQLDKEVLSKGDETFYKYSKKVNE